MTLQVMRWTRYGKDRLYVNDPAGQRVGWVDLLTGDRVLERPEAMAEFEAAVAGHLRSQHLNDSPPSAVVPEQTAEAVHEVVESAWTDLALNVPGQAARAQAEQELAAMRERTRVGTVLARAFDLKTDERAWRVGANGEETVGAKLEKLRKHGWHVLHAVPVGDRGSDIDHVLIGPGGVWTINTKNHPGKAIWVGKHQVRVDGHRVPYLRNSRFEAERASRLLTEACGFPVFAKAALVFLTGTLIPSVTIKALPDEVAILDRMHIPGRFRRAKRRWDDAQVEAVYAQARRSTTWTGQVR